MQTVMFVVPACIILFLVARKTWRIYKDGLLLALLQLGLVIISAALAFVLARMIFNPAKVDFLQLGQKIIDAIPADFFLVCPSMEAFVRALPTAICALIGFTVFFEVIRVFGARFLSWLVKKNKWNEIYLQFPGSKVVALAVGAMTAALAILIDLVILNGIVAFSGNMLRCAQAATGESYFGTVADALVEYEKSPIKRITDALGCRQVFNALTTGSRDGESFSVGQELTQLSTTFAGIMPVFEAIPTEDHLPEAQTLRDLPRVIAGSPASMELITGLVRASRESLSQSDAVLIASTLLGTTPERFSQYLSQITVQTAQKDLETFCNIAALLRQYDLLPGKGNVIQLSDLENQALMEDVAKEVKSNLEMARFFYGDGSSNEDGNEE